MHILDTRLAQEIVTRTMRIIPFNVNVMDGHGVILASGNPERVGELHAGALLALAKKLAVEIDAAAETADERGEELLGLLYEYAEAIAPSP